MELDEIKKKMAEIFATMKPVEKVEKPPFEVVEEIPPAPQPAPKKKKSTIMPPAPAVKEPEKEPVPVGETPPCFESGFVKMVNVLPDSYIGKYGAKDMLMGAIKEIGECSESVEVHA